LIYNAVFIYLLLYFLFTANRTSKICELNVYTKDVFHMVTEILSILMCLVSTNCTLVDINMCLPICDISMNDYVLMNLNGGTLHM
jgi:hypothetical protein